MAEVRGGVGTMAAVELSGSVLERHPDAVNRVVMGARQQGVLVRGLGRGVAVSPPLSADTEHFALIHDAIAAGLAGL